MEHNARSPRLSYNLAVARKPDGGVIGWIGIGQAGNPAHGKLDSGYALLPDYWGQGYMTEALAALPFFAFAELGGSESSANALPATSLRAAL